MLKKRVEKLEQIVPEQKKKIVIGVGARHKELGIDVFYIQLVPKQVCGQ